MKYKLKNREKSHLINHLKKKIAFITLFISLVTLGNSFAKDANEDKSTGPIDSHGEEINDIKYSNEGVFNNDNLMGDHGNTDYFIIPISLIIITIYIFSYFLAKRYYKS
ncbi:MAG: hypothetical protein LBT10_01390 [Methanobrevibacter sp.]|jgi:hypothetical protein|nr:hypothetical protein [Methanobrevibacter sp.]